MWETIVRVVSNGEMPPKRKKTQPSEAEKAEFLTLADETFIKVSCVGPKNPGRVTLRRLNRAEYNNTIRDLCGIDYRPADDFPSDDVGYGFDNIGDVLSMPPILLEKYLVAAENILNQAVVPPGTLLSSKQGFRPQNLLVQPREARSRDGRPKILFTTAGQTWLPKFNFPADGEYILRFKLNGIPEGDMPPKYEIKLDDQLIQPGEVRGSQSITVEVKRKVAAGERKIAVSFVNPSKISELKSGTTPRTLGVELIEIEGPLQGASKPLPKSTQMILVAQPKDSMPEAVDAAARAVLNEFARRAYRRPPQAAEIDRLMQLFHRANDEHQESFAEAIKLPLKAILVSPHFLFRVEKDPLPGQEFRNLSDFELASRLSYFLWSSMPDEELYRTAERGQLRQPEILKAQVQRMLKDPKSRALTENFAGQWLQLRNLLTLTPDPETFQGWDESLRKAMIQETELFFDHIVKNDRSILEFLDADYTFLNDRLSWHYGVPNIRGEQFRYVKLPPEKRRGGLMTQASTLTVTSNPTRTSPVKRGKWIYENIMGLQPPPAAPDVPELPPNDKLKGTLRQQMEQHRSNPACAGCHAKLDPLGFGLENFDGIGRWRDTDNQQPIDASGVLPEGESFNGPSELRKVMLGKAELFRKCLAEKLLTFALGRGLEYYDKCVLDEISLKLKQGNDQFSALVLAIVQSEPFIQRKLKRSE